jgi:hypothetical protein
MPVSIQELTGPPEDPEEALDRLVKSLGLSDRQKMFVYHYVRNGGDRRMAALEAGYHADKRYLISDATNKSKEAVKARNSLSVSMTTLMKNPKVTQAIDEYRQIYNSRQKTEIEKDVYRLAKVRANYDIRSFADMMVGESPEEIAEKLKQIPEEMSVCIDSITFKYHGKDADKFTVDFKFADRQKSIEFLSKLTGLMVDKKEVKNTGTQMPQINIAFMNEEKKKEKKVN